MRLKVRIPNVEPELCQMPTECPYEGCHGKAFKQHQQGYPRDCATRSMSGWGGRHLHQAWLRKGQRIRVIGADVTKAKCKGESLPLGVVGELTGIELTDVHFLTAAVGPFFDRDETAKIFKNRSPLLESCRL